MSQTIELPDTVYSKLVEVAAASGTTPVGWISERLSESQDTNGTPLLSEQALAEADARLEECIVTLGCVTETDNEQIDTDLAREYGDNHAEAYRGQGNK